MNSLDLSRAQPIAEHDLPNFPGCYVLIVDSEGVIELGFNCNTRRTVLYIGKAEDSIRNRVNSHLLVGGSGSSTLRRSIGALLQEKHNLNPQPRSENPTDSRRFKSYKFDNFGEEIISNWIISFISILCVRSSNPKKTEKYLVSENCPLLNLTGWLNPERAKILSKRANCAQLAKYEVDS